MTPTCSATAAATAAHPVDFSQSLGTGESAMAAAGQSFFAPTTAHASSSSDPSVDKYTAAFSGAQG